jgi:Flp pilus assembly protein CpaB
LKRSNRLVLLVGVFLAVIAFVGIALLLGNNNSKPPDQTTLPPKELPTVVAAKDIPLGVVVTQDMLTDQTLPVDQRRATAFQADGQVIGLVARRAIKTGAQLEAADFDTTSTSCGTIDVPTTLRAIAVQTDQVSGVGTIINSGDYIDMLVGFTADKFPVTTIGTDGTITVVSGLNGTSVKLLLEGMQVLCRQLPPPAAPANGQPAQPTSSGNPNAQTSLNGQQEIVILGVTATQAEVIKFAQLDGSISLVLRSRTDFQDASGNPVVAPPSGSKGVTLKVLTTDFSVRIPEIVEGILPARARQ